jgi:hypothetical protein
MFAMQDQRRAQRFDLRLPAIIVRAGTRFISHAGRTLNISSGGVLLSDPGAPLEVGETVEYLLVLPTGAEAEDVRVRCRGKIVRRDGEQQAVAATLERYEFLRGYDG